MATYNRETEGMTLVHQFADQVKGKTFLLTGPSPGGLGAETVISLATESPAMIILVGRTLRKAQPTLDAIRATSNAIKTKFVEADLASLKSVRAAAQTILADPEIAHIDVVINNAGVMATPFQLTVDGLEFQLQSNHLGHFVLTNTIMPKLAQAARIVLLSSSGHRHNGVRFADPNFAEPGSYSEFAAYGQAKTAVVLYAVALNARLGARGVRAFAVDPGHVATGLQANLLAMDKERMMEVLEAAAWRINGMALANVGKTFPSKTLQQGVATVIRAALDPELGKDEEGVFLEDVNLTTDPKSIKEWATDPELAEKSWKMSEELVGEKFDI
ncbi:NAD(P)-binding protein [Whalleya microplaca]|nr:NAD(P)-binding protein [Whalleya microplaca]